MFNSDEPNPRVDRLASETSLGAFVEPQLEFDDAGCELAAQEDGSEYLDEGLMGDEILPTELEREEAEAAAFGGGSITPDGLIDEDFEQELGPPVLDDDEYVGEFADIAKYGVVEVSGDDMYGRKVVTVSACRMPPIKKINHQRLLQYLKATLDQYVESDYTLVYFHYGLNSRNKPSFSWLRQAYKEFDRKYKKNLKALFLVHPTNFIRVLYTLFKPFISLSSAKFGRKVSYVNYLHQLGEHLHLDQLRIPGPVKDHDTRMVNELAKKKRAVPLPSDSTCAGNTRVHALLPTQQFGVSLQFIKDNNNNDPIPPVVYETVDYLQKFGLDTQGLFRISAVKSTVDRVQHQCNMGEAAEFQDVHTAAVILKTFLREMPEPVFTFAMFERVRKLSALTEVERVESVRRMVEDLPEDNVCLLRFVLNFLQEVAAHAEKNRMTPQNLAIVFGPNLIWPQAETGLSAMGHINTLASILLHNHSAIFDS